MTEIELRLSPTEAHDAAALKQAAAFKLGLSENQITDIKTLRRSVDARGRDAVFQLRIAVYTEGVHQPEPALLAAFKDVSEAPPVIIVGAGPAGYFAALATPGCWCA